MENDCGSWNPFANAVLYIPAGFVDARASRGRFPGGVSDAALASDARTSASAKEEVAYRGMSLNTKI